MISTNEPNDQDCPSSRDGNGHCECWWDGEEPCCWCGFAGDTDYIEED